jgi:hypothetical protein
VSHYDGDNFRTCPTCGNQFHVFSRRMSVGAIECRSCEMGLVPERQPKAEPPSAEYLARRKALWIHEGACVECGTPPNGDLLRSDGRCGACVLAMEKEQEEQRKVS